MKRNRHAGKQQSNGFSLNVLSGNEIEEIHLATLEVLADHGVFVEDEQALEVYHSGGARIDRSKKMVRLPNYLVEEAVRAAPASIRLAGRRPEDDVLLESSRVGFTNFGAGIQIVDPYTDEVREPTKKDLANVARVIDAMSEVDVFEKAVGATDVPQEIGPLHYAEAFLPNTTKHCFSGPDSGDLLRRLVRMGQAIVGGPEAFRDRPLLSFITCPVSPLKLTRDCCEIIMGSAEEGVPVNILSMAMAGATSPMTLAGTLVTHNAEVLAGVVLSQLTCKGTPVIYGSSTTAMDMRTANAAVGSAECAIINAAVARLALHYSIPSWVAGG